MDTNKLMPLLPDLAVFVAVVEAGSFTAASKVLGVTPSAVSRKISRLEDALSIKLLERTTRKISMSESGEVTYNYCRQMLHSANEAVNASRSIMMKPIGNLKIAAPKAYAYQVLRPLVFSFMEKYPDIKLTLKVTDKLVDPIYDDVDLIFRLTNNPTEGLVSKIVGKVDLVLCASPEYIKKSGIPKHPSDLVNHECLYLGDTVLDNEWKFVLADSEVTVKVDGRYVVNHTQMRLEGIEKGLGIGILPDFTAKQPLKKGRIIRVLENWTMKGNYQGVISLQFAQSQYLPAKCRVFIDYMVEKLK